MPSLDPFAEWSRLIKEGGKKADNKRESLLRQMANLDGRRAWDLLTAKGGRASLAELKAVAEVWGAKQGYVAATFGLTLTDPIQRGAFLRQALSMWLAADSASFLNWMHQQPADLGLDRYIDVTRIAHGNAAARTLTLADLDVAVAYSPSASDWGHPLNSVFEKAWASPENRAQASAWIGKQTAQDVRDAAWRSLALEVAKVDLRAAGEMADQIQNAKQKREVTSTIAARLAQTNAQDALAYANSLTDDAARQAAWRSAMATWTERQPNDSLAYVRDHLDSISFEDLAASGRPWGLSNPTGALAILAGLASQSDESSQVFGNIISEWMRARPLEAQQWLASDKSAILPATIRKMYTQKKDGPRGYSTGLTRINDRRVVVSHE